MKGFKTVTQGCTTAGRLYNEDYDGPLIPLTKKDLERISKPPTTPPMESKMDDIKTVTHEGTIYQIGKAYLVDDGDGNWILIVLRSVVSSSSLPFRDSLMGYRACKNAPADSVGTITPAPAPLVPLIHGKAYTFDYGDWKNVIGVYSKAGEFLGFSEYCNIHRSIDCTNIRPMAVVEGGKS
tara:strand:+ start:118 stop:660 length:543 start_codon:yes stop_codon:yes gene_type:complete